MNLRGSTGMYASKLISNSVTVIKQIPEEDGATETDSRNEEFLSIKTLAIVWKAQDGIHLKRVIQLK